MHRIGADPVDELAAIDDADELCRLLLGNPTGWRRSTRHAEAVELLTRVHGTGELPAVWASPQWLEIDLHDGTSRTYTVTDDTPAQHHVRPERPLRRWAARHALHNDPARLTELLSTAEQLEPRHRDAAIHGLLDTANTLDEPARRTLIDRGLRAAHGSVRIAALEHLCELDGPDTARGLAAADPNAQVRKWRPPADTPTPSLFAT